MIRSLQVIFVLIIAAVGLLALLLENPDDFKAEIADAISSNTEYQVDVDGSLAWRYWPPIAIQVEDIKLIAPDGKQFAQIEQLEIDVDLIPLLTSQYIVDVNSISINGGQIDYESTPETTTTDSPANDGQSTNVPPPTVHEFNITDLAVNFDDAYRVQINDLTTSKLAIDSPFDVSSSLQVDDLKSDESLAIGATGQLIYQSNNRIRFDRLVSTIKRNNEQEITINAAGEIHPDREVILLNELNLTYETLIAKLRGIVNYDQQNFDGEWQIETADLASLAQLTLPIKTLQLNSGLQVSSNGVRLTVIEGQFDETTFKGNLLAMFGDTPTIESDLRMDQLDLRAYESSATSDSTSDSSEGQSETDAELIPLALRDLNTDLILRIDKLNVGGYELNAAKIEIDGNANKLELIANAQVIGGKLVTTLNSDWASNQLTLSVDRVNVASLSEANVLTGSLTGNGDYYFDGHRLSDLENNLSGKAVFTITDGSIDVRPIKRLAATIDTLRGKTSTISTWPDVMPFNTMTAQHLFQDGTKSGQVLNAQLENLHLTALGGLDLGHETMDYEVTAMFEQGGSGQFSVSDQLAGIRWPMRCQGNFTDEPVDLCFGQQGAIQDLVADIAKQEIRRRGNEKLDDIIEEKVPEELQDLTRDLLKGLFKKRD